MAGRPRYVRLHDGRSARARGPRRDAAASIPTAAGACACSLARDGDARRSNARRMPPTSAALARDVRRRTRGFARSVSRQQDDASRGLRRRRARAARRRRCDPVERARRGHRSRRSRMSSAEIDGVRYTPPLACGLLGGTFRAELLDVGRDPRARAHRADVAAASRLWLINSVREWIDAVMDVGGRPVMSLRDDRLRCRSRQQLTDVALAPVAAVPWRSPFANAARGCREAGRHAAIGLQLLATRRRRDRCSTRCRRITTTVRSAATRTTSRCRRSASRS